jgi:uncharacterized protein YqeY
MALAQRIQDDMVASMKAREPLRTSVLRMVIADLKNLRISKGSELVDDDVLSAIKGGVKRRKDSVEQYTRGGRQDLADKEQAEIAILEGYLPASLPVAEVEQAVAAAIAETGATGKKDMGKVMKAAMARLAGRADGKLVSQIVASRLA